MFAKKQSQLSSKISTPYNHSVSEVAPGNNITVGSGKIICTHMLLECCVTNKILYIINKISFLKSYIMVWEQGNELQVFLVFTYLLFLETKVHILNFRHQGTMYLANAYYKMLKCKYKTQGITSCLQYYMIFYKWIL